MTGNCSEPAVLIRVGQAKLKPPKWVVVYLAAHIEKNANQIIDQIIKIAELLTDADVSLYRGNN